MTTGATNKLVATLIVLLVVVAAVQSVIMFQLHQRLGASDQESEPVAEPIRMDLLPKAGAGQPPVTNVPQWNSPLSTFPSFGGLGVDPDGWDPFKEFRSMRQQMDQMFNDSFGRFQQSPDFESLWGATAFSPSMDVEEKDGNYVVRMDIPGADKANISVNIDDRVLTVSGKIDKTVDEQGQNQLRKERRSGEFKRSLTLPGPVKSDEMEAKYEGGVLTVTLPKAEEQGGARKIEIK